MNKQLLCPKMTAACPDKHRDRMKWIDTYPDEISVRFDHHHELNDMIGVPRFQCYFTPEDSTW